MLYQSKPSRVEAIQWTGDNIEAIREFGAKVRGPYLPMGDTEFELYTGKDGAQGWTPVPVGHWIVRRVGDYSDHWPVDSNYFADKYEPVDE